MRHNKAYRKFGRTPAHRRAMFRNMATSLFQHEKIETTLHKAKDLRSVAEKLITTAKEDNLHNRRKAYGYLQSKAVVHKLFAELGPRYKDRPGGYTRVVRTRRRNGDAAELAVIQLVQEELKPKKKAKPKKKKAAPKKKKEEKVEAKEEEKPVEEEVVEAKAEEQSEEAVDAKVEETQEGETVDQGQDEDKGKDEDQEKAADE